MDILQHQAKCTFFEGFLKVYLEVHDDDEEEQRDTSAIESE
jgi:hypothetical protein